jgi:hypothetical protein
VKHALALAVMLCACEASVGVGGNGVDATTGRDADTTSGDDAPDVDAASACANGRVVFLSFEGESLTQAGVSDAKTNRASWMQIASGAAPAYHAGSVTRMAEIQAVVNGVRAQLSSFPIEVVTTRPQAGDYVMVVFGGERAAVGSRFGAAVQELDCGDLTRNDVAWIADSVSPNQKVVNFAIGAIGFGLGLTATLEPTDCMCGWDNACQSDNSVACSLTPGIARDPNANQRCNGLSTQDEVATFAQGFCQ